MNTYDVIVIGLGAMGSAALYQLAKQSDGSHKVLGIDQFEPPHSMGSSHGFKHSPAIGEALAQQILTGKNFLNVFETFLGFD